MWFLGSTDVWLRLDQCDVLSGLCCFDDVLLGKIRLAVKNSFQGTESLAGGKNSFQALKKYIFHLSVGRDDMARVKRLEGLVNSGGKHIFQYRQLRGKVRAKSMKPETSCYGS